MMAFPVAPPGATMAISFQSDEEVLRELRDKLRKMTDEELLIWAWMTVNNHLLGWSAPQRNGRTC
jgi:hypothetical protein